MSTSQTDFVEPAFSAREDGGKAGSSAHPPEGSSHGDSTSGSRGDGPPPPWAREADDIAWGFNVSPAVGYDETTVRKKRQVEGPNSIESRGKRSTLSILLGQIQNAVSLLPAAAAIVSLAFGHVVEGITILAALFINVVIGFVTEVRANRSLEALGRMGTVRCRVKRDGRGVTVPARDLVRGDIVEPAAGDIVPADIRLLECRGIQADESALTGESVRVGKTGEVLPEDTPLHSRTNMLLRGTAVVKGEATGIVTAVGMDTELGKISQMAENAEEEVSPLERRLNNLATRLMMLAGGVTALVGLSGYLRGKDILLMLRTAVALAVAAIPEGLPVVATNPFVWGALLLCSALLLLTVFLPVLRTVLNVTRPSSGGWLVILSFALIPFVFVQAVYGILGRRTRADGTEEARANAGPGGAVSNAGDRRRMDSKTNEGRQQ